MSGYTYLAGDLLTGAIVDELPLSGVSFGFERLGAGAFSASINRKDRRATRSILDPGRTMLLVDRDGVIVWSGILWRALAESAPEIRLEASGWWSYFHRRRIRTTFEFAAADQFGIVTALIDYAQSFTDGDIGLDTTGVGASGVLRDRTYRGYERKVLGQAVEDLADNEDGFNLRIDTAWDVAGTGIEKTLVLTYPAAGRRTEVSFDSRNIIGRPGLEVTAAMQARTMDALGAGEAEDMLIATASDAVLAGVYPLYDDVVSYKDVSELATLGRYARQHLQANLRPRESVTLRVRPVPGAELGAFIAGDEVRVDWSDQWGPISGAQRIESFTVAPTRVGGETLLDIEFVDVDTF